MAERRMGIIALLLCFCLCLLPIPAQAASTADALEPIDPTKKCDFTLSYRCDGKSCADIPVAIYRIADVSADCLYTLTSAFAPTNLVINGIQTSGEWDTMRTTLESYILAEGISPSHTGTTDSSGQIHFASIDPGIYLVAETVTESGSYFASTLVALPTLGTDGLWQYQVAVSPKPELLPPIEPDEKIQLKVVKLWRGDAGLSTRPQSVTVEIFRNGASQETVLLFEENNWSYIWAAEKDNASWTVVERNVPAGYASSLSKKDTTFTLTNTWITENPDDIPTDDPPKTGDTSHLLLYLVLMYISGGSLILLGIAEKRKRS